MSSFLGAIAAQFGHLLNKTADSPQTSLAILFALYKSLLITLAFCSPDDGFDKSTIFAGWPNGGPLSKLVKWDAIWFTNLAQRGYKYEQDFAFGYGYTNLLAFGQYLWGGDDFYYSIQWEAIFGIFISHVSHLLGTLLLYRLSLIIFRNHERGERIAFLASILHVISPAGIFICAPYTESPFSFLAFGAYFAYACARLDHNEGNYLQRDIEILLAGGLLGVSCTFRSNGLLNGMLFLIDAIEDGLTVLRYMELDFIRFRRMAVTVVAGLMVGFGQVYPQIIAWQMFCTDVNPFPEKRPWCYNFPPSIYTFVQVKYWDNGFLHYWQVRQIPLFLLATPVLVAMFWSTYWVYTLCQNPPKTTSIDEDRQPLVSSPASLERTTPGGLNKSLPVPQVDLPVLVRITIPQTLIGLTCLFVGHVQIVTRLSSAYPVWYWWLAVQLLEYVYEDGPAGKGWRRWVPWFYGRWTIMYGVIQTGLYAEFLPPA